VAKGRIGEFYGGVAMGETAFLEEMKILMQVV